MDNLGIGWQDAPQAGLLARVSAVDPGSTRGFGSANNSTTAVINQLKFEVSKSVRTSFTILASFNAFAGAVTASGIFWDCYMGAKRKDPNFRFKTCWWRIIGPAEVFPFVLSLTITVQGIIFAVVQSKGLQGLLILDCTNLSQILLPAFLSVPYVQFTFGLETIIQALRLYHPLSPRGKWNVHICLAVAGLGQIGTYVLAHFVLPPDFCFASLAWFLQRWSLGIFGILVGIASSLLAGSIATINRLYRVSGVGELQRITASWMAWYMALGAVMMSIMTPFFYSVSTDPAATVTKPRAMLAMAAVVVSNLTGLMTGGMYVLLRSSRLGKIGPRGYYEFDIQRRNTNRPRVSSPHNMIFTKQMEQPVGRPAPMPSPSSRASSVYETVEQIKNHRPNGDLEALSEAQSAPGVISETATSSSSRPQAAVSGTVQPSQPRHARNNSYNLFPPPDTIPDVKSMYLLPSTAYIPTGKDAANDNPFADEMLPMPPSLAFTAGHNRDSSLGSSATVPIGIRVSNINDLPPVQSYYQVPQSSVYDPEPVSQRLSRPISGISVLPVPASLIPGGGQRDSGPMNKDKQLPPVPLALTTTKQAEQQPAPNTAEEVLLSPMVYSPQRAADKSRPTVGTPIAEDIPFAFGPEAASPPRRQRAPDDYPRVKETEWI